MTADEHREVETYPNWLLVGWIVMTVALVVLILWVSP